MVTVAEAMEQLGIKSKDKIYELMSCGELSYVSLPPHTKQAGRRIEQSAIDDFIARNRRGVQAAS
jgi:hypothetical protein